MTFHRFLNWLIAVFAVLLFVAIQQLDQDPLGLSLRGQMERDIAAEAEASRAWAARTVCGENAAYEWRGNDLQCFTKHGKKAGPVVAGGL